MVPTCCAKPVIFSLAEDHYWLIKCASSVTLPFDLPTCACSAAMSMSEVKLYYYRTE